MKTINRLLDIWEKSIGVHEFNTKLKERALNLEEKQFDFMLQEHKRQQTDGDPTERMMAALHTLGKKSQ